MGVWGGQTSFSGSFARARWSRRRPEPKSSDLRSASTTPRLHLWPPWTSSRQRWPTQCWRVMTDADGGADEPLLATELHLFSLSSLLLAIDLHRNFFLSFSLYIYIYFVWQKENGEKLWLGLLGLWVLIVGFDCWLLKFRPWLIVLLQIKNKFSTTLAAWVWTWVDLPPWICWNPWL